MKYKYHLLLTPTGATGDYISAESISITFESNGLSSSQVASFPIVVPRDFVLEGDEMFTVSLEGTVQTLQYHIMDADGNLSLVLCVDVSML